MPEGSGGQPDAYAPDFAEFVEAGVAVSGEFHCSECGYGVVVQRELPRCPMCRGTAWEPTPSGAIRRRAPERLS